MWCDDLNKFPGDGTPYLDHSEDTDMNRYPQGICYIAIETGPVEIVSFPINCMVVSQSDVNVY